MEHRFPRVGERRVDVALVICTACFLDAVLYQVHDLRDNVAGVLQTDRETSLGRLSGQVSDIADSVVLCEVEPRVVVVGVYVVGIDAVTPLRLGEV